MNAPEIKQGSVPASSNVGLPQRRKLFGWVERLLACVGLCFIVYRLAFEFTVMTSDSMAPTLQGTTYENGDHILLEKVSGYFCKPKRWEIYFYYDGEGTPVAKRIVGLPGEKISIKANQVYINGEQLQRPEALRAIKDFGQGTLAKGREMNCGGGYFMLGDASADSYDSRYTGVVTGARFRGRVWCVISPRGRMGFIE